LRLWCRTAGLPRQPVERDCASGGTCHIGQLSGTMKSDKPAVWGDVAFCGLLIAGGVILLQDLSTLKHAVFDPLGSATVPRALIWLVIVLATIVAAARLLGFNVGSAREVVGEPADGCTVARRLGQVGAITALVAAYVYTIAAFLVPF